MDRRTFMKSGSLGALAFATGQARGNQKAITSPRKRTLVLIELLGGNDGLNTLIPFTDPLYYQLRPSIAIPKSSAIPITDSLAMHPAMQPLMQYWQHKNLAWIQGVGYPNSSRSHFRSVDIWDTASNYNQKSEEGWVAKLLGGQHDISGLAINSDLGPFTSKLVSGIKINDINAFIRNGYAMSTKHNDFSRANNHSLAHLLKTEQMVLKSTTMLEERLSKTPTQAQNFPNNQFGRELASIARLINSGVDIPCYKVSLSNFDTHTMQPSQHARLLTTLAESLHAFSLCMRRHGHWDDVLVMTYSEFGRQVAENESGGTDHGAASAHLVMGGGVRGGVYGPNPDLARLNQNALRFSTDFRAVYGTIASRWWNLGNPWKQPLIAFV